MTDSGLDYEGTITKLNPIFAYCELDNQVRVHMSILLSEKSSLKLPRVQSRLSFKNAHKYASTYVLCSTSVLNGEFTETLESRLFIQAVKKYRLGAKDLLMIDTTLRLFEKHFLDIDADIKLKLIVELLENLKDPSFICIKTDHVCLNEHISHLNLISVNSCRHIEIKSTKYNDFPYWSFGLHSKPTKNTLLFGIIIIQPFYGFLMLKDSLYQIVCVISNGKTEDLYSLVDSYVLIKNYKVITEIFKDSEVPNLEYILVNFADIIKIYSPSKNQGLFHIVHDSFKRPQMKNSLDFRLIRKSMTCVGCSKKPECWLEILISKKNNVTFLESVFLILPSEYVKITSYLQENGYYQLCYNVPLSETSNIELTKLRKYKIYEIVEKNAYFQLLASAGTPETPLTIEECKQYLLNSNELVSFTGVLTKKRFVDALASRIPKRTTLYGFGTPGVKSHQLVFSCLKDNTQLYLDCYLSNWDNTLMPLGLIPQARVVVKNVLPQSKKYLKASVFTSFEILSYDPLVEFQTATLFGNFELDWGPRFFLGQGNSIPYGVIIWGRVLNTQILSVNMSNVCKNCRLISESPEACVQCGEEEKQMQFLSNLHVADEYGQSKVFVKHPEFLKPLLDLQDKQFEIWMKAFAEIGQYTFNMFPDENPVPDQSDSTSERDFFKTVLTSFLLKFNRCAIQSLDFKCRKLDSNPEKNGGRPLWFCIDVRKS